MMCNFIEMKLLFSRCLILTLKKMLQFLYSDIYTLLSLSVPVGSTPRRLLDMGRLTYSFEDKVVTETRLAGSYTYTMPCKIISIRQDLDRMEVLLEDGTLPHITEAYWSAGGQQVFDFSQPHCLEPYLIFLLYE